MYVFPMFPMYIFSLCIYRLVYIPYVYYIPHVSAPLGISTRCGASLVASTCCRRSTGDQDRRECTQGALKPPAGQQVIQAGQQVIQAGQQVIQAGQQTYRYMHIDMHTERHPQAFYCKKNWKSGSVGYGCMQGWNLNFGRKKSQAPCPNCEPVAGRAGTSVHNTRVGTCRCVPSTACTPARHCSAAECRCVTVSDAECR